MKPGGDPVIVAILKQIDVIDGTLRRLRVPTSVHDDLKQDVLFTTWRTALRGGVRWKHRGSLRAFLRVVTMRAAFDWWQTRRAFDELHEADAVVELDAERLTIARSMLRFLRCATTPERWRAVRARANGVPAHEVTRREHVPTATIYTRLRLVAKDFDAALRRDDASIYVRRKK